jgi:hypothetical protein
MPCRNVVASEVDCCDACVAEATCEGWVYEAGFDCSAFGLGTSVGVCHLITDVITLDGELGWSEADATKSSTLWG